MIETSFPSELNGLFKKLAPHVQEIDQINKQNQTFQLNARKGEALKAQFAEECANKVAVIRKEHITPAVIAHMHKHHLVPLNVTDEDIARDSVEVSIEVVEPLVKALYLSPDKDRFKAAAERYVLEAPLMAQDTELLAPYQQLLNDYTMIAQETGLSVAGPLTMAIEGIRDSMRDYREYYVEANKSRNADPSAMHYFREAAMLHHEEAYKTLKPAYENLKKVCDEITGGNDQEPDFTRTVLKPGLARAVEEKLARFQTGYPDVNKSQVVVDVYDAWEAKHNTQKDEERLNARGKAAIWLRNSYNDLKFSHQILVDNKQLFDKCEKAVHVVAEMEAAGEKPSQEALKETYKTLCTAQAVLMSLSVVMEKASAGIPGEVPDDMKEIERKFKYRAAQQLDYLNTHRKPLDDLQTAMFAPMDSMEQAWMQAEVLRSNARAFFEPVEKLHKQWEEHKKKQLAVEIPG